MNRVAKILVCAFVGLLLTTSIAMAGSTNVITNSIGQVITVVSDNFGVHVTSIVTANRPSSQSRTTLSLVGVQLDTETSTTITAYTPRDYGDVLIGKTLGTGVVWMATGVTSNDWKALSTP